jgi:small nuclear ribonucleoprotein (snRNP)-like protein
MKPLLKPLSLHHIAASKVLCGMIGTVLLLPLVPTWAQNTATLQDGTRIRLEVLDDLSSNKSRVGQDVKLRVREDVLGSKQEILIRKGAPAFGRVTRAKGSGGLGRSGKLEFIIESVQAVDGSKVPLRSEQEVKGRKRYAEVGVAAVLLSPLALFIKGRNASIKAGTPIETYVNEDATIEVAADMSATENATENSPAPATNAIEIEPTIPNPTMNRVLNEDVVGEGQLAPAAIETLVSDNAQTVVVALANGRKEEGVLTDVRGNHVSLLTDVGLLRIDDKKITSIVAQEGQGTPQTLLLKLRNGKEVQGTLDSYQNGAYVLQTAVGSITVKKQNVLSLSLANPAIVAETD